MKKTLILSVLFLVGCTYQTTTFLKPYGNYGKQVIRGCSHQIPNIFLYSSEDSKYFVKIYNSRVYFIVETPKGSLVNWKSSEARLKIGGKEYLLKASDLAKRVIHSSIYRDPMAWLNEGPEGKDYIRKPCGDLTELFNCNTYVTYNADLSIPTINNVEELIFVPPTPEINGIPFKTSEITYKKQPKEYYKLLVANEYS